MPTGVPADSDHHSLVQPWRERSEKRVFAAKEQRLRERVAELYEHASVATDANWRAIVRRSLVESENLLDLAADALRRDWLKG